MAVLAMVIGEGSRRGRYLRRVSLVQIESKCDRRVNPAAMPRLHETEKWAKVIKFAGIKAD
jgi:hypothetical protein